MSKMIECVHQHIMTELQMTGRIDTTLAVTAIVFDLIMLVVNGFMAGSAKSAAMNVEATEKDRWLEKKLQECLDEHPSRRSNTAIKECQQQARELHDVEGFWSVRRPMATTDGYLLLFLLTTLVMNISSILALMVNRNTRGKLLSGLRLMYEDHKVGKYYDPSLLHNHNRRYQCVIIVISALAFLCFTFPLTIRYIFV